MILKLLAFTVAMVVVPIGSYFATVNTVFKGKLVRSISCSALLCSAPFDFWLLAYLLVGNSSYAGGLAALMANVVLLGYVIVAMNEDQSEQLAAKAKGETKKGR